MLDPAAAESGSGGARPGPGHNSAGVATDRLRAHVDRVESLEEDRKALGEDIKNVYTQAKSDGFDVKVLRRLIQVRRMDAEEVAEQETLLDTYRRSLGR